MNNYTTETYQIKRESMNFSNKLSEGCTKPTRKFCDDMIYGMFARKSVVLTEIARALKEKTKLYNVVDRLSNNLTNLDEEQLRIIKENYEREALNCLKGNDEYVIVPNDDTDLNHEYSQKMEDVCLVRDASSQKEKYVYGYKVCEYVALSPNQKSPISLYSKVYSTISNGFKSENEETILGENEVISKLAKIGKKPIFVRDRGYDSNKFFIKDIKEDNKFITRLKNNRNLIFKGRAQNAFNKIKDRKGEVKSKLMYKGENRECYISYKKVKLPAYEDKEIYLVSVHGLSDDVDLDNDKYGDDNVIMFLTNIDVFDKESCERIVRIYFLRWRIEEYFKSKKQNYDWEDSIVRTLKGINNLNLFLTAVMLKLTIFIEKLNKSYLSNIIIERAMALKNNCIIWFGQMSQGIYEILKFAHTGIKEWRNIEKREKCKQLALNI